MKNDVMDYFILSFLCCLCFAMELKDNSRCDVGWFGYQCQYKCHCLRSCGTDGECPEGCEKGWFGAKCQYQDLVVSASAVIKTFDKITKSLADNDEKTCINDMTVRVDLNSEYNFGWLRTAVKYTQNNSLYVSFQNNNKQNIKCNSLKKIEIDNQYIDIQCFSDVQARYLTLHVDGLKMCSLWISGGKNVALKQVTKQSSTEALAFSQSWKAVDGKTDGNYETGKSCTHTKLGDPFPNWNLTFQTPFLIKKINIYNRQTVGHWRLRYFFLNLLNKSGQLISQHPLNESPVNTIFVTSNQSVKTIVILFDNRYTFDFFNLSLTLCEVETYAECPEGKWGLKCDQMCNSTCPYGCRPDDGQCTNTCIGFSDPTLCTKDIPLRINVEHSKNFQFSDFGIGVASLAVLEAIICGIVVIHRRLLRRKLDIYNQPDTSNSETYQHELNERELSSTEYLDVI